jgi:hypothetical protein
MRERGVADGRLTGRMLRYSADALSSPWRSWGLIGSFGLRGRSRRSQDR